MQQHHLGILIGGSSHVGKSTLAKSLAVSLGRELISTDKLGRHPGRPWPTLRPQVAEYYSRLSDDTVHWFLKVHHENMWPYICQIIENQRRLLKPFILEGSALRPEYMTTLDPNLVRAVFLYAEDDFLRARMMEEAGYKDATQSAALVIEKFVERSIRDKREMLEAARDAKLQCVDVAYSEALEALAKELAAAYSVVNE
ncbi:hypothetical protein [Rhizobium sp. WYCCWR 11146]|uniref:hypothetical protein n=1 Tax=Rhizobium sp. WYCCWR 11146 TaxID=2749833 RepID=UPI0015E65005|nr:hypothetical protein [Rhizobium sp. WYCCWR 11146]MBA1349285.1 hypothetical protein [Rhizobium sp. WYCCWR 11146]